MEKRITGHTELLGLVATPIRHSKSPLMHNAACRALGLDYAYLAFDIQPVSRRATKSAKALGLFCGPRSRAAGWKVPMNRMPFFSMNCPCSLVTEKSDRIIRWAAMRPRHTTILGRSRRNCSRSQGMQASLSAGRGSRFWGGRHLTMLAM